jgi:uncharacterized protein (TIGR03435 family)
VRYFWRVGVLLAVTLGSVWGQAPGKLEFEVATIRPALSPAERTSAPENSPERVYYIFASVRNLLMKAYGLPIHQVLGPSWIDSDRYDIEAKVPVGTSAEQVNEMLRNLLADRVRLKVHRETRELPLYELVVARGGAKLKNSDPNDAGGRKSRYVGRNYVVTNPRATMAEVADILRSFLDRPMLDRTGLMGTYAFNFTYTPDTPGNQRQGPDPNDINVFTAVQEQLGLRLEATKGPLEVVVVDQGERAPTGN